jgi:hypothetical protein
MAPPKNKPGDNGEPVNSSDFKKILAHLKNDGRIFLIVLLGIGGMFIYTRVFFLDKKTTGYNKEYWLVKDFSKNIDGKNIITVDTLKIIYHAQIGTHRDSAIKERTLALKNHTKPDVISGKLNIDYDRLYFAYNSAFLVWIALGSISFAFALASTPVLIVSIRSLILKFKIKWLTIGFITLFSIIIGVLMYETDKTGSFMGTISVCRQFNILVKHPGYLPYIVMVEMLIGLLGFAGQMIVNAAINKLPKTINGLNEIEQKDIGKKFLLLRNQLKFFLIIDSILIVFSVLTVNAFIRAILAEIQANVEILPQTLVYLNGLLFTFYLAVIYIPIYSRLKAKGEQMLDDVPQTDQEGDLKPVTAILRIQQTPIESFQVVISILAPVLTSLAPGLLKI